MFATYVTAKEFGKIYFKGTFTFKNDIIYSSDKRIGKLLEVDSTDLSRGTVLLLNNAYSSHCLYRILRSIRDDIHFKNQNRILVDAPNSV